MDSSHSSFIARRLLKNFWQSQRAGQAGEIMHDGEKPYSDSDFKEVPMDPLAMDTFFTNDRSLLFMWSCS